MVTGFMPQNAVYLNLLQISLPNNYNVERNYMTKIVAVNGSPRPNCNTAQMVKSAAKGAEDKGAEVHYFDLYKLEKFTGCVSCFRCMKPESYGVCSCRDGLLPILDAIRQADGLILGTPNYLGDISAGLRSLYERLIFQYITYRSDGFFCNEHKIPVLFIMTSNAPMQMYAAGAPYEQVVKGYVDQLSNVIGPTELSIAPFTQQVKDYSKYSWNIMDVPAVEAYHETEFPKHLEDAYAKGAALVG